MIMLYIFLILCLLYGKPASSKQHTKLSPTEQSMLKQGMVDIQTIDSTIRISLMYSRPDNFTGQILYSDLHRAYLHPKAAKALAVAQKKLQSERPDLSLIVFDACRPMHIQQKMWNKVKGTAVQNYVSNPARGGGLHNYGMAVDISICNAKGDTLDMGTKVDCMSPVSHIDREDELIRQHKMSKTALQNRRLLRKVMREAGFKPLRTEWWHFNLIYRAEAKRLYKFVK